MRVWANRERSDARARKPNQNPATSADSAALQARDAAMGMKSAARVDGHNDAPKVMAC